MVQAEIQKHNFKIIVKSLYSVLFFPFRCQCGECSDELLFGALEHRCCWEVNPAMHILTFDGSIEQIKCVTLHDDYRAITNTTVLKNVAPFLKDKNGRSYRQRAGQTENE